MKKQKGPKRGVLHERCAVYGKREKKGCRLVRERGREGESRFGRWLKDKKNVKDHLGDGVVFERCIWADLTSTCIQIYVSLRLFVFFMGAPLRRGSDFVPHCFDA